MKGMQKLNLKNVRTFQGLCHFYWAPLDEEPSDGDAGKNSLL